jgi:hypothetical protein
MLAQIMGYVIAPDVQQPQGCAPTRVPGHYVIVIGDYTCPHVIKKSLLAMFPDIFKILPVPFEKVSEFEDCEVWKPLFEEDEPVKVIGAPNMVRV